MAKLEKELFYTKSVDKNIIKLSYLDNMLICMSYFNIFNVII